MRKSLVIGLICCVVMVVTITTLRAEEEEKTTNEQKVLLKVSEAEDAEIQQIMRNGVGERYVIEEIMPNEEDRYKRGPAAATVRHFKKWSVQGRNVVFIGVIGQYLQSDKPLLLPGGNVVGTRSDSKVVSKCGSISANLSKIPITVPAGLYYYHAGAARTLMPPPMLSMEKPGIDALLPSASGSIHRFIGRVSYKGHRFQGDLRNGVPLTFLLLKNKGYVHAQGYGSVVLPDGTEVDVTREE